MTEGTHDFDLFLSYNRLDRKLVDPLAEALRERGLRVFKDDWHLRPGQPWPAALERNLAASRAVAVAVGPNGLGPWQQREAVAALDFQSRAREYPVIPVLLDRGSDRQAGLVFLLQNTWVECWDPRAADLIAAAVRGQAPAELQDETYPDPRASICPYRGLGVFREEDAGFYFGRESDLDTLTTALARHPLVAVVGASGSGKSSLARAGLMPTLRRRSGEGVWQMASMMPGRHPFLALARVLLPLREPERVLTWTKDDIDEQCERLQKRFEQRGAEHLAHVVGQILEEEPGTTRLLLLVDQWEELYTYRPTDGAAGASHREQVGRFIRMLLEAVRLPRSPLRVVVTLRADYWGEVLNDGALAAQLPDSAVVHLRALDREALEKLVRQPAATIGLRVQDGLAEVVVKDALGQPGDLPLLEYTLQQLWTHREGATLTFNAYKDMGGLERAIVARAEAVYDSLAAEERDAVPGIFSALVQVGETRTDLRRRARLAELGATGQVVAHRLADERLLVTSWDWNSGDELVEVAHEALLRHWPQLEEWIDARRGALLTLRQLQADTRTWIGKQRNPSYLWSHERAREAALALKQVGSEVTLSDQERDFLGPVDPDLLLRELARPDTTHKRRAYLGERLDALGDPRPGVGVDANGTPDIVWCRVTGGEVTVQTYDIEGGVPFRKRLTEFQLARYPVTAAQYRAFVEAADGTAGAIPDGGRRSCIVIRREQATSSVELATSLPST